MLASVVAALPGDAEVVAVDVDRVRQPERVGRVGERLENRARRHAPAGDGVVETGDVSLARSSTASTPPGFTTLTA